MKHAQRILAALLLLSACSRAEPRPQTAVRASTPEPLGSERVQVVAGERPVVELRVVFEAGSADDPQGKEGLTHLTALTMLQGEAGGLSYAEREQRLYPWSAELDVQVEREQVTFSARVPREHFRAFYPLFRDILLAPAFRDDDLERLRARTLSQLTEDLRGADDEALGKEALSAMLYEGHPYGHPVIGLARALRGVEATDLRNQRERALCASRVRVAVSGLPNSADLERLRADLGTLPRASCAERVTLSAPREPGRRLEIVAKDEAQSVAVSIGVPITIKRGDPDYAALTVAAAYLGQHRTFAGRLMQKMRGDRGLNYGDYAYAEHFEQDGQSRFPAANVARRQQYFSLWLRPVPEAKAHFALRMALRELAQAVDEGLSQADFERIQAFTVRYYTLFAQTEQQRLGYLLDEAFYGLHQPTLSKLCADIAALTRDQVNTVLKKHVRLDQLQIAMVAPHAQELAERIAAEQASPITYEAKKPAEVLAEDRLISTYPIGLTRQQISIVEARSIFE